MTSGITSQQKHPQTGGMLRYLSYTPPPQAGSQEQAKALEAKTQAQAEARVRLCEELIKDEAKLAEAVMRHLERYPSIGSLRLALDLLGPCAQNLVDAFLRHLKPVLIRLEKMGLVELVRGDPVIGIMVVNLARRNDQGRGGEG